MDPLIAHAAKLNYFDAAHYTWILLRKELVLRYNIEQLNSFLLEHGDYAAPLRTEEILLPFEHIALLLHEGNPNTFGETFLVTIDCHNSRLSKITQWSGTLGGNTQMMVFDFQVTKDDDTLRTALKAHSTPESWERFDRLNGDPVTAFRNKTLVSFDPRIDKKTQNDLLKFFVPTVKTVVRYIAAASAGLLAGEQLTYHKPKGNPTNAKRIRRGKAPLYEWTTLQLETKPPELPAAPKGGTHASPRLHQRRGHWATSKLGKKFWRRESVVGDPEKGMIFHDYKTTGAQDAKQTSP